MYDRHKYSDSKLQYGEHETHRTLAYSRVQPVVTKTTMATSNEDTEDRNEIAKLLESLLNIVEAGDIHLKVSKGFTEETKGFVK